MGGGGDLNPSLPSGDLHSTSKPPPSYPPTEENRSAFSRARCATTRCRAPVKERQNSAEQSVFSERFLSPHISRFIAQLTPICEPIFKLLRKKTPPFFLEKIDRRNEDCQKAFDKVKKYLKNPPILVPLTPGRPLLMYLSVMEASMSCVLGQHDETGRKERAIYYLSKKFTDYETRYTVLEKTCCALTWASQRLRHYMLNYTTMLIARMDPLKYLFEKPALTGRTARWQM